MIEVIIRHKGSKTELGRIEIENTELGDTELGTYAVRFAVDRIAEVGLHNRAIHNFPRLKFNVLALLRQALATLEEEELKLPDETSASDLARQVRGIGKALQRWSH